MWPRDQLGHVLERRNDNISMEEPSIMEGTLGTSPLDFDAAHLQSFEFLEEWIEATGSPTNEEGEDTTLPPVESAYNANETPLPSPAKDDAGSLKSSLNGSLPASVVPWRTSEKVALQKLEKLLDAQREVPSAPPLWEILKTEESKSLAHIFVPNRSIKEIAEKLKKWSERREQLGDKGAGGLIFSSSAEEEEVEEDEFLQTSNDGSMPEAQESTKGTVQKESERKEAQALRRNIEKQQDKEDNDETTSKVLSLLKGDMEEEADAPNSAGNEGSQESIGMRLEVVPDVNPLELTNPSENVPLGGILEVFSEPSSARDTQEPKQQNPKEKLVVSVRELECGKNAQKQPEYESGVVHLAGQSFVQSGPEKDSKKASKEEQEEQEQEGKSDNSDSEESEEDSDESEEDGAGYSTTTHSDPASWKRRVGELKRFFDEYGRGVEPSWAHHSGLKTWVDSTRVKRASKRLTREEVRELDRLGFIWDAAMKIRVDYQKKSPKSKKVQPNYDGEEFAETSCSIKSSWKHHVSKMRSVYRKTGVFQGEPRPPLEGKNYKNLRRWIKSTRKKRTNCKLTREEVEQLDDIHFPWTEEEDNETASKTLKTESSPSGARRSARLKEARYSDKSQDASTHEPIKRSQRISNRHSLLPSNQPLASRKSQEKSGRKTLTTPKGKGKNSPKRARRHSAPPQVKKRGPGRPRKRPPTPSESSEDQSQEEEMSSLSESSEEEVEDSEEEEEDDDPVDEIGPPFADRTHSEPGSWSKRTTQLQKFFKEFGVGAEPKAADDIKYKGLKRWINLTRAKRRTGKLTRDEVRHLNTIGFTWTYAHDRYRNVTADEKKKKPSSSKAKNVKKRYYTATKREEGKKKKKKTTTPSKFASDSKSSSKASPKRSSRLNKRKRASAYPVDTDEEEEVEESVHTEEEESEEEQQPRRKRKVGRPRKNSLPFQKETPETGKRRGRPPKKGVKKVEEEEEDTKAARGTQRKSRRFSRRRNRIAKLEEEEEEEDYSLTSEPSDVHVSEEEEEKERGKRRSAKAAPLQQKRKRGRPPKRAGAATTTPTTTISSKKKDRRRTTSTGRAQSVVALAGKEVTATSSDIDQMSEDDELESEDGEEASRKALRKRKGLMDCLLQVQASVDIEADESVIVRHRGFVLRLRVPELVDLLKNEAKEKDKEESSGRSSRSKSKAQVRRRSSRRAAGAGIESSDEENEGKDNKEEEEDDARKNIVKLITNPLVGPDFKHFERKMKTKVEAHSSSASPVGKRRKGPGKRKKGSAAETENEHQEDGSPVSPVMFAWDDTSAASYCVCIRVVDAFSYQSLHPHVRVTVRGSPSASGIGPAYSSPYVPFRMDKGEVSIACAMMRAPVHAWPFTKGYSKRVLRFMVWIAEVDQRWENEPEQDDREFNVLTGADTRKLPASGRLRTSLQTGDLLYSLATAPQERRKTTKNTSSSAKDKKKRGQQLLRRIACPGHRLSTLAYSEPFVWRSNLDRDTVNSETLSWKTVRHLQQECEDEAERSGLNEEKKTRRSKRGGRSSVDPEEEEQHQTSESETYHEGYDGDEDSETKTRRRRRPPKKTKRRPRRDTVDRNKEEKEKQEEASHKRERRFARRSARLSGGAEDGQRLQEEEEEEEEEEETATTQNTSKGRRRSKRRRSKDSESDVTGTLHVRSSHKKVKRSPRLSSDSDETTPESEGDATLSPKKKKKKKKKVVGRPTTTQGKHVRKKDTKNERAAHQERVVTRNGTGEFELPYASVSSSIPDSWNRRVTQLKEFRKENGSLANDPRYASKGIFKGLRTWVERLRKKGLAGKLTRREVKELDALGFSWTPAPVADT